VPISLKNTSRFNIGIMTGTNALLVASADAPQWLRNRADYTCDGTADQVEFNAAAAALPANGGVILLSPGVFNFSAPGTVLGHSHQVIGSGTGHRSNASQDSDGTRIQAVSGFTGTEVLRVQSTANTSPLHGVTLRDFTVDGGLIGTAVDNILFRSHTGTIDNVHSHRATGWGIRLLGYPAVNWATYDSVISGVRASYNTLGGLWFDDEAQDCHVILSVFYYNGTNIRIGAGSQQITACHTYSGTDYNVWFDGSGSRTKIVNLKCEQAGKHGIFLDGTTAGGSDVEITACNFKNNGYSSDGTYDHVSISGGTFAWSRVGVNNCHFSVSPDSAGDAYDLNRARSAVYLGSNSRDPLVSDITCPTTHVRTAVVVDSAPSGNRAQVGIGTGLAYTTLASGARLYVGGSSQPSGMVSGDFWLHDA
jgi:hypothetical protein